VVSLVRQGHLRLLGRAEWFNDRVMREQYDWPPGRWRDGFDDKILEILEVDRRSDTPRVVIAPAERGWDWAEEQLAADGEAVALAKQFVQEERLPPGTLQKIKREIEKGTVESELLELRLLYVILGTMKMCLQHLERIYPFNLLIIRRLFRQSVVVQDPCGSRQRKFLLRRKFMRFLT
jgi:hypothetical protein